MATTVNSFSPEIKNQLAQVLLSKFELSPALLKEVVNKATGIAEKSTLQSIQARFKQSGIIGLTKDLFKNIAKRTKDKISELAITPTPSSAKKIEQPVEDLSKSTKQNNNTNIEDPVSVTSKKTPDDKTLDTDKQQTLLQQILKHVKDINNKYNKYQTASKIEKPLAKPTEQITKKQDKIEIDEKQLPTILQPTVNKIQKDDITPPISKDKKNKSSIATNNQKDNTTVKKATENTKSQQPRDSKGRFVKSGESKVIEIKTPTIRPSLIEDISKKIDKLKNTTLVIEQTGNQSQERDKPKKGETFKNDIFSSDKTQKNIKEIQTTNNISPDTGPIKNETPSITETVRSSKNTEKDFLKEEEKPKQILIAGFTPEGVKSFQEHLPNIFESIFKKLPQTPKEQAPGQTNYGSGLLGMLPKGLLALGGGLGLLLGGLAALVTGLQTEGPFKGLLKILSRVGLQGGLKLLETGAKTFLKNIKGIIKAPVSLLRTLTKNIGKIFGVGAFKAVTTAIKGAKGIFVKMLGGLVKLLSPILKRVPLIGTAISLGFAYTRFKSGDTVGGIIDVLSGIATIFPGVGTAISIGLDVLNAFLDYKTGGATKETSKKKSNWLGEMWGKVKEWFSKNAEKYPVIGPAMRSYRAFKANNILEGLKQLAYIAPPFELLGAMLGDTETSEAAQTTGNWFKGVLGKIKEWVSKNIEKAPVLGPAAKAYRSFKQGDYLRGLKQLAYIIPAVEIFGAMVGDKDTTGFAQGTGNILKKVAKWAGETLYKVFKSTIIIGPAIKAVEAFQAGEYLKGFKQLAYIMPGFEILGAMLGDTETTGMAQTAGSAIKSVGQFLGKVGSWVGNKLYQVAKSLPVVGPAIKAVEAFMAGDYLKGFKQLAYIAPPFEILGAMLGDTETTGMAQTGASTVKSLASLFGSIKDLLLKKLLNLLPESILGISIRNRVAGLLGISLGPVQDDSQTVNGTTPDVKTTSNSNKSTATENKTDITAESKTGLTTQETFNKNDIAATVPAVQPTSSPAPIPLAEGGVVTQPVKAIVGEAGSEAVIPLEKFFKGKDLSINNAALDQIAANTQSTNESIRILGTAILKLAQVFDSKPSSQAGNNIFINGQQQSQTPSASQVAASNVDPIRLIRQQFGIA